MTIYLKQSTASQEVLLPRFLDSVDGDSEETGLSIANTDIKIWKNGATTLADKNSGGATHIANGLYYCVLDATDTGTLGPLTIEVHKSGAQSVRVECVVLAANIFDSLIGGGDLLDVSVTQWLGTAASTPTVAGVPNVNVKTWNDLTTVDLPLAPTTAGRKLDVSTGGEAGIDWANVGSPTTTVGLSGTTVKTATDVETDTQDIQSRLPAALGANGNMKADVLDFSGTAGTFAAGRPEVNASHAGGTEWGSGAITAGVFASGAITSAKFAASAINSTVLATGAITSAKFALGAVDAAALAADAASEIAAAVWNLDATGHQTAGTFGEALGDPTSSGDSVRDLIATLSTHGDSTWATATGFSTHSAADVWAVATRLLTAGTNIVLAKGTGITGFNDLSAAQVNAEADTALADYDAPTKTEMDAAFAALNDPTAAAIADAVWEEAIADHSGTTGSTAEALNAAGAAGDPWTTVLPGLYGANSAGNILGNFLDVAISSRLAAAGYTAPLDAAGVRTAVGLASANLDTQLAALPTADENAAALLDLTDGIETSLTLRKAMRLLVSTNGSKVSGAGTGTEVFRDFNDTKDRVTASDDADGNRTAITYDLT